MALRYWVGNGSSQNWNATAPTNWGTASGVQDDASVPGAGDDVIFDGAGTGGNDNSTISATITILSLDIQTGYTGTMTHNAVLTIAGNWTYTGAYTIAGASGITISATSTITSNGVTWPNNLNLPSSTITLNGNLTVNSISLSGDVSVNKTTTETLTITNGMNTLFTLGGNVDVYLTGGTYGSIGGYSSFNTPNLYINGNVTFVDTLYFAFTQTCTLTYLSGTVTTTGTTLIIRFNCVLNTNGITWNNVSSTSNGKTITLTSNLSIAGLLSLSVSTTVNRTTSETMTCSGGFNTNSPLSGTANIIWNGGTWTSTSSVNTISNNLTISGNVTFSGANTSIGGGTWTYSSGTVTTTGNTLNIRGNCTLNLNGISFNDMNTGGGTTVTLTSNLLLNGSLTPVNTSTINRTTTETLTCNGLGFNAPNRVLVGTAKIILIGGTWAGNTTYSSNIRIENDLEINGNVTISSGVTKAGGTLTYVSGVVTTTGSTLFTRFATTLNTNGITWNNITTSADGLGQTITLTSNISIAGLLNIGAGVTTTINRTTAETITCAGGMTINAGLSGTATINWTGGTWTGTSTINNSLDINGNVTISGNTAFGTGTITYVSGNVVTGGGTLTLFASCTVNTKGINWNNITLNANVTVTLTSDLNINNLLTANVNSTVNSSTSEVVTVNNGYTLAGGTFPGTTKIILRGGNLTGGSGASVSISNNLDLEGNITIVGDFVQGGGKTLKYVSGNVRGSNSTFYIQQNCTILGFGKVPLKAVVFTGGRTLTTDDFFTGTPSQICQISSLSTNYNITTTDNNERILRNIAISNATFTRPMQYILTTNQRFNTNRGTNIGLRYNNQMPNGVPKNNFPIWDRTLTGIQGGLQADPCFVRQG